MVPPRPPPLHLGWEPEPAARRRHCLVWAWLSSCGVARQAGWLLGSGVRWLTFTWVAVNHDLVFALAVCHRDVCEKPKRGNSKNGPGETRGQMQLGGGRRHEHLPSTSGPVGAESCLEDQR